MELGDAEKIWIAEEEDLLLYLLYLLYHGGASDLPTVERRQLRRVAVGRRAMPTDRPAGASTWPPG